MHLLDLIHFKSEKLQSEIAQDLNPNRRGSSQHLQAISEDEVTEVEQLRRERLLLMQRVAELEGSAISGQSSQSNSRHVAHVQVM